MEIDFKDIRPLDGDLRLGFEELCCQLAQMDIEQETGPNFLPANFHRKEGKAGDAGVECYYIFPDGKEWGWQAKYFIDGLGLAQWRQIDQSVKAALEKHSHLVRYTICIPINLSDARLSAKKSQMDHRREHQNKWSKRAREKGRNVEFVLWGEYELRKRLVELGDRGAGYLLYWFGKKILTTEWFLERFEEASNDAGARYTPELHVDLPISAQFDAFGRTDSFRQSIEMLYDHLLRKWKKVGSYSNFQDMPELAEAVSDLGRSVERQAAELDRLKEESFGDIPIEAVTELTAESVRKSSDTLELVERLKGANGKGQFSRESRSALAHQLTQLQFCLDDIADFAKGIEARLAQQQAIILSGEAGTGKTHLFCDLTKRRIADRLPTVLLLGGKFSPGSTPWSQIVEQLHLEKMEAEEFLGALDAAARVRGKRALILIDALNEGAGAALWKAHLAGMLATLQSFPRVVLAVSCRESYVDAVIPENLLSNGDICVVRHCRDSDLYVPKRIDDRMREVDQQLTPHAPPNQLGSFGGESDLIYRFLNCVQEDKSEAGARMVQKVRGLVHLGLSVRMELNHKTHDSRARASRKVTSPASISSSRRIASSSHSLSISASDRSSKLTSGSWAG